MLVLRKAQPPRSRPSPASCPASSSHAYPQTLESRAVCYSQKRLIHTPDHFRNRLVQSDLCRHKLCRLWVRPVCPYSCTSFPPSSHASQPERPMSCLNMQAPSRQSLNIRVFMGASALTIFVSCQDRVPLGGVGKRKTSLLCILLSPAVPLLHCLNIVGT